MLCSGDSSLLKLFLLIVSTEVEPILLRLMMVLMINV